MDFCLGLTVIAPGHKSREHLDIWGRRQVWFEQLADNWIMLCYQNHKRWTYSMIEFCSKNLFLDYHITWSSDQWISLPLHTNFFGTKFFWHQFRNFSITIFFRDRWQQIATLRAGQGPCEPSKGFCKQIRRAVESQREPERARESLREPEWARESRTASQREPEWARESQREPDSEPERARVSQREPERARESQREPERARESRTASQKEPEWARESRREPERVRESRTKLVLPMMTYFKNTIIESTNFLYFIYCRLA